MFTKQTAWKNLVSREFIVLWICTTTRGFGGKQSCAVWGIKLWGIHEFWFIWDTWIFLVFSVSIFDEHWYNFVVKFIIITSNKTYTKITLARTKCCFKKLFLDWLNSNSQLIVNIVLIEFWEYFFEGIHSKSKQIAERYFLWKRNSMFLG